MPAPALRILIPVDGSPASLRAASYGAGLVQSGFARGVILLNVQPPVMSGEVTPLMSLQEIQLNRNAQGDQALADAARLLSQAGVAFEKRTEIGEAGATIARVAEDSGCGQIVMGTRGLGRIANLVLGSVATQVLQQVAIPVTLIK